MEEKYFVIVRKKINGKRRFIVVDKETGDILDDAQGFGYRSKEKALNSFSFKQTKLYKKKMMGKEMNRRVLGNNSSQSIDREWLRLFGNLGAANDMLRKIDDNLDFIPFDNDDAADYLYAIKKMLYSALDTIRTSIDSATEVRRLVENK